VRCSLNNYKTVFFELQVLWFIQTRKLTVHQDQVVVPNNKIFDNLKSATADIGGIGQTIDTYDCCLIF